MCRWLVGVRVVWMHTPQRLARFSHIPITPAPTRNSCHDVRLRHGSGQVRVAHHLHRRRGAWGVCEAAGTHAPTPKQLHPKGTTDPPQNVSVSPCHTAVCNAPWRWTGPASYAHGTTHPPTHLNPSHLPTHLGDELVGGHAHGVELGLHLVGAHVHPRHHLLHRGAVGRGGLHSTDVGGGTGGMRVRVRVGRGDALHLPANHALPTSPPPPPTCCCSMPSSCARYSGLLSIHSNVSGLRMPSGR